MNVPMCTEGRCVQQANSTGCMGGGASVVAMETKGGRSLPTHQVLLLVPWRLHAPPCKPVPSCCAHLLLGCCLQAPQQVRAERCALQLHAQRHGRVAIREEGLQQEAARFAGAYRHLSQRRTGPSHSVCVMPVRRLTTDHQQASGSNTSTRHAPPGPNLGCMHGAPAQAALC